VILRSLCLDASIDIAVVVNGNSVVRLQKVTADNCTLTYFVIILFR